MADWEVALDKQIDTWLFLGSDKGRQYLDLFLKDVHAKYPWEVPGWIQMGETARRTLWQADPIFVTPEMMTLLEHAWPSFEPEDVHESDVFLPSGFVYLPRPVYIHDVRGKRLSIRAMGWLPTLFTAEGTEDRPGMMVTFFSAPGDVDDYWEPERALERGRFFGGALALSHQTPVVFGRPVAQSLDRLAEELARDAEEPGTYDPLRIQNAVDLDTPEAAIAVSPAGVESVDGEMVRAAATEVLRFTQALWRLLGQRVAVGMRMRPSRGGRKRLDRAGAMEKYITVVTLRRPKGQPGEQRHVDWAQRWIVSGHWRWQPYGDGTHRQIWIAPYIKGPEDKPLVIRGARVFRWAR